MTKQSDVGCTILAGVVCIPQSDQLLTITFFSSTGEVGITLNVHFNDPKDPEDPTHVEASERRMQFDLGWFANPIFGSGDYPQVMRDMVATKSALQGYPQSRLPEFTEEEIEYIKGM